MHYTTSLNTQSSALEDGRNNPPKYVELAGIINKPLLLHLVGFLYYSYLENSVSYIRVCYTIENSVSNSEIKFTCNAHPSSH